MTGGRGMAIPIGTDLGASNIVIARLEDGRPVPVALGATTLTPAYVRWGGQGRAAIIGDEAKAAWRCGEPDSYRRFKLDLGLTVEYAPGITPEGLTQALLETLHARLGQAWLGRHAAVIGEVVVSAPHGWDQHDNSRRLVLLAAARAAGFDVARLISEPVAAAAYYAWREKLAGERRVLVCDMGGGTFDISLVETIDGGAIKVIDSEKNDHAGAVADAHIVRHLLATHPDMWERADQPSDLVGILASADPAVRHLLLEAEQAKEELNRRQQAASPNLIQRIHAWLSGERAVQLRYEQVAEALEPMLDEGRRTIATLLARHPDQTPDLVVVAGGMGKMLVVQRMVAQATGRSEAALRAIAAFSDHAIAFGAALVAGRHVEIEETLKHSIGIAAVDASTGRPRNYRLVERGAPLPLSRRVYASQRGLPFLETGQDEQTTIATRIVFGESDEIDECFAAFEARFAIPSGPSGRRLDFWVDVDANGIVSVGLEGEGMESVPPFQGTLPRRTPRAVTLPPGTASLEATRALGRLAAGRG